jgi:uncharacterized lipoprotein YmbA
LISSIRKLRVFLSLDTTWRLLLIETLSLSVATKIGFRIIGVPRTQHLLRRWAMAGNNAVADGPVQVHTVLRAQRMVNRTTDVAENCLVRSLTLWAMLLRRGLSPDLRVGFRKRDGQIQGHAWVEFEGVPINETEAEAATFATNPDAASYDIWRKQR